MEEEALEYAHGLFTKDGYNGSLDEYKELISTNEEALDYSFDLFTKDGYKDDKSTFTSLLGVSDEEVKKKQTSESDGEEGETTTISDTEKVETTQPAATSDSLSKDDDDILNKILDFEVQFGGAGVDAQGNPIAVGLPDYKNKEKWTKEYKEKYLNSKGFTDANGNSKKGIKVHFENYDKMPYSVKGILSEYNFNTKWDPRVLALRAANVIDDTQRSNFHGDEKALDGFWEKNKDKINWNDPNLLDSLDEEKDRIMQNTWASGEDRSQLPSNYVSYGKRKGMWLADRDRKSQAPVAPKTASQQPQDEYAYLDVNTKFESGSDASSAIGYDAGGGTSYGTIQIASKQGAMDRFIKNLQDSDNPKFKEIAKELSTVKKWDTGSNKGEAVDKWKEVSKKYGKDFLRAEKMFAHNEYTQPLVDFVSDKWGVNADQIPSEIKSLLASRSIQHGVGGAKNILSKSWSKDIDITDSKALIESVYKHLSDNVDSYFKKAIEGASNPEQVRDSLINRFTQEPKALIDSIGQATTPVETEEEVAVEEDVSLVYDPEDVTDKQEIPAYVEKINKEKYKKVTSELFEGEAKYSDVTKRVQDPKTGTFYQERERLSFTPATAEKTAKSLNDNYGELGFMFEEHEDGVVMAKASNGKTIMVRVGEENLDGERQKLVAFMDQYRVDDNAHLAYKQSYQKLKDAERLTAQQEAEIERHLEDEFDNDDEWYEGLGKIYDKAREALKKEYEAGELGFENIAEYGLGALASVLPKYETDRNEAVRKATDEAMINHAKALDKYKEDKTLPKPEMATQEQIIERAKQIRREELLRDKKTYNIEEFLDENADVNLINAEQAQDIFKIYNAGERRRKNKSLTRKVQLQSEKGVAFTQDEEMLNKAIERYESLEDGPEKEEARKTALILREDLIEDLQEIIKITGEIEDDQKDLADLGEEADLIRRDYDGLTNAGVRLATSTLSLASGIAKTWKDVNDMVWVDVPTLITTNTGWDLEEFSKRMERGSKNTEAQLDAFDEYIEELNGSVRRSRSLEDVTSLSDFAQWFGDLGASQIPQLAAVASTGGYGLALLSSSAYGNKLNQLEKEMGTSKQAYDDLLKEYNKLPEGSKEKEIMKGQLDKTKKKLENFSPLQMRGTAFMVGVGEYLSERVTQGIISRSMPSKRLYSTLAKANKGDLSTGFKKGVKDFYNRKIKKLGVLRDPLEEGASEVFAQGMENIADKYIMGKDIALTDGMNEAFWSGAAIGAAMKVGGSAMGLIIKPAIADRSAEINDNLDKIRTLNQELERLNAMESSESVTKDIERTQNSIAQLDLANGQIIADGLDIVDRLTLSEFQELGTLEQDVIKTKEEFDQINESSTISPAAKKIQLEQLEQKYNDIVLRRDSLMKIGKSKDARYTIDGRDVSKKEMSAFIQDEKNLEKYARGEGSVKIYNDSELGNEFVKKVKPLQDAIQEPSTEEVDAREQARDGEAVGVRDTKEPEVTEEVEVEVQEQDVQQKEKVEEQAKTPKTKAPRFRKMDADDISVFTDRQGRTVTPRVKGASMDADSKKDRLVIRSQIKHMDDSKAQIQLDNLKPKKKLLGVIPRQASRTKVSPEATYEFFKEEQTEGIRQLAKKLGIKPNAKGIIKIEGKDLIKFGMATEMSRKDRTEKLGEYFQDFKFSKAKKGPKKIRESYIADALERGVSLEKAQQQAIRNKINESGGLMTLQKAEQQVLSELNDYIADKYQRETLADLTDVEEMRKLAEEFYPDELDVEMTLNLTRAFTNIYDPKEIEEFLKDPRRLYEKYKDLKFMDLKAYESDIDMLIDELKKTFPNAEFFTNKAKWDEVMASDDIKQYLRDDEIVYGVTTSDGKIYLNPEFRDFNTPIHEAGHVWTDFIKKNNPELYKKGLELVEGTPELKEAQKDLGDTEAAREEALAVLIGNKGDSLVAEVKKKRFKNWLTKLWESVRDAFPMLRDLSTNEIQDLTLNQFVGGAVRDILSGKPMEGKKEEAAPRTLRARKGKAPDYKANVDKVINEEVLPKARENLKKNKNYNAMSQTAKKQSLFDSAKGFLQQTTWYAQATDIQREAAIEQIRKQLKVSRKAAPTAPQILGQHQEYQKTQAELKEVRKQAKMQERAIKEFGKLKNEVKNIIKKIMPSGVPYFKGEVNKLLEIVDKVKDPSDLAQAIDDILDFATKKMNEDITSKIDSILGKSYSAVQAGRAVGKTVSTEVKTMLDLIKSWNKQMKSKSFTTQEMLDKINKELNELTIIPNPSSQQLDLIAAYEIAREYVEASAMDDTNPVKTENLIDVYKNLDSLVERGKSEKREAAEKRAAEYSKEEREALLDTLEKKMRDTLIKYKDEAGVEQQIRLADAIAFEKDSPPRKAAEAFLRAKARTSNTSARKAVGRFVKSFRTGLDKFIFGQYAVADLVDIISKSAGKMMGGKLQDLITNRLDASSRLFKKRKMQNQSMIEAKLMDLYGKDWMKELSKNRMENDMPFAGVDGEPYRFSQDQLMYLYNQFQDPANRPAFESFFEDANMSLDKIMEKIEEELAPQLKDFADWQRNELFPSLYKEYNETYKDIYGTNMPWNQHYAGRMYYRGEGIEQYDLLTNPNAYQQSIGGASTKIRLGSKKPIDPMNGMDVLMTYLTDMEHFHTHARALKNIDKIIKSSNMKNAVEMADGKEAWTLLNEAVKAVAQRGVQAGKTAKVVNALTDAFIVTRLGMNPAIGLKQLTSAFTFSADIGLDNWLKYGLSNIGDVRKTWSEIEKNSVYIQDRYKEDIRKSIDTYSENRMQQLVPGGLGNKVLNMSMYFVKAGDKGGIMGGMPNYLYYKAQFKKENPNATEQEAIDHAIIKFEKDVKTTQQSNDIQDRDLFQRESLLRTLVMFKTSQKQYFRKEAQALRQLNRALQGKEYKGTIAGNIYKFAMFHAFMPMVFQWVAAGFPVTDWEEEDKTDILRAMLLGNFNALFIMGDIFQSLSDFAAGKPWGADLNLGPWDDIYKDILKPTSKIMTAKNDTEQYEAIMQMGLGITQLATKLPLKNLVRWGKNINKVLEGDAKTAPDALLYLFNFSEYSVEGPKKKKPTKILRQSPRGRGGRTRTQTSRRPSTRRKRSSRRRRR